MNFMLNPLKHKALGDFEKFWLKSSQKVSYSFHIFATVFRQKLLSQKFHIFVTFRFL